MLYRVKLVNTLQQQQKTTTTTSSDEQTEKFQDEINQLTKELKSTTKNFQVIKAYCFFYYHIIADIHF